MTVTLVPLPASQVLLCDDSGLANGLAENMSKAVSAAIKAGTLFSFILNVYNESGGG